MAPAGPSWMTYLIRRKKIRESEKEKEGAKAAAPAWIAVLDFFQDQAHELLGILEAAVEFERGFEKFFCRGDLFRMK